MASPAAEEGKEKADQQPPPPMAPPMEELEDLRPPFSFLSLLLSPDEQPQQQMIASAMELQEIQQQRDSVVDAVADDLLRLSLQQEPVIEDDEGGEDDGDADEGASTDKRKKLNKDERKKRRALKKLGMEPVTGVSKVTFVQTGPKNRKGLLSFSKPDVFKFPGLESYAIFGEGSLGFFDLETQAQTAPQGLGLQDAHITYIDESDELTDEESSEDEYDTDDTGIEPGDISIVMEHAAVSWRVAVKALKLHGDVVDAIMDLTS